MGAFIDLNGRRFDRLTVLKRVPSSAQRNRGAWLCQCVCGKTPVVLCDSLLQGKTKSCGCLRTEWSRINLGKNRKVWVDHNEERLSTAAFVRKYGKVSIHTVRRRLKKGVDVVTAALAGPLPRGRPKARVPLAHVG